MHNHYYRQSFPRRMHHHCKVRPAVPWYYYRNVHRQRCCPAASHRLHQSRRRHPHQNRAQTLHPHQSYQYRVQTHPLHQSLPLQSLHLRHHHPTHYHHRPYPWTIESSYRTTFPKHFPDSFPWQSHEYSVRPPSPPLRGHRTTSIACVPPLECFRWHPSHRRQTPLLRVWHSHDGAIRVAERMGRNRTCGVRRMRAWIRVWMLGW
mmetsp:Transcript_21259/g.46135  ORF Transcript_21259/g.46135 Transcript_21259/m.46135 type:complete len:205 (+) Transcript_21259:1218-1832(+)